MIRACLSFAVLVALAACGSSDTSLGIAGFDTSCAQDTDCVAVQSGDLCGCDCGNAAINKVDLASYQIQAAAAQSHCGSAVMGCDCAYAPAVCTQGQCALSAP
jgi:hypothetical protein